MMEPMDDISADWCDIMTFAKTDTNMIFSVRGVCGVNRYIENTLLHHGIMSASDLVGVFVHFYNTYGRRCNDKLGKYMDDIGIKNPRRMIIISALEARKREIEIEKMRLKPHLIIHGYFE